jgi:hypothetical protein
MKYIITLIFILYSITMNSQCNKENIIPFEIGMSKFDITKIINSNSNLSRFSKRDNFNEFEKKILYEATEKANNGFVKYNYLNEKVYKTVINLYNSNEECFIENHIMLYLVDDYLYKIDVSLNFDNYNMMIESYTKLNELIQLEFKYTKEFTITNRKTGEKIGEGKDFYKLPYNEVKINYIQLNNKINYKNINDNTTKEQITSAEVENYEINISIVDLTKTKLTNQGY